MSFTETKMYKKGNAGENIIRSMIVEKGWITYSPDQHDKAHYFDMLATKDKKQIIALDVKTKARLNKWVAQGIDERHYKEYRNFKSETNINFYIFFVDDKNGDIHYAELDELKSPLYPKKGIIAWPLSEMHHFGKLNDEQIKSLSQYDTRSYSYNPVAE